MEKNLSIYDVCKSLCGKIEPIGESNEDEKRFDNLKVTIDLVDSLIDDIIDVASYKYRPRFSESKAGVKADEFLNVIREKLEL